MKTIKDSRVCSTQSVADHRGGVDSPDRGMCVVVVVTIQKVTSLFVIKEENVEFGVRTKSSHIIRIRKWISINTN